MDSIATASGIPGTTAGIYATIKMPPRQGDIQALVNINWSDKSGGSMDNIKFFIFIFALLILAYIIRTTLGG